MAGHKLQLHELIHYLLRQDSEAATAEYKDPTEGDLSPAEYKKYAKEALERKLAAQVLCCVYEDSYTEQKGVGSS